MRPTAGALAALLATASFLAFLPGGHATLAVEDTHIGLGKVDPGHRSTHMVAITNSGTTDARLVADVLCDCPHYVTVQPERFELAPDASQDLTISIDVPDNADPGIHNTRIRITEVVAAGPGGTGQAAYEIDVTFWVRTARIYFDPVQGETTLPVKIVNGYDENLSVEFDARLTGPGLDRPIPVDPVLAEGSPNARTTHVPLVLPFLDGDPAGVFQAQVTAQWSDPRTGEPVRFGPEVITVARGAAVALSDFQITKGADGTRFTARLENTGGAPVSAWVVVGITRSAGSPVTVESARVELAPGASSPVEASWNDAAPGRYTAVAHAAFTSAAGQSGVSQASEPGTFTVRPASGPDGGGEGLLGDGPLTTVLLAAGAAAVGAAAAVLVLRRRKA